MLDEPRKLALAGRAAPPRTPGGRTSRMLTACLASCLGVMIAAPAPAHADSRTDHRSARQRSADHSQHQGGHRAEREARHRARYRAERRAERASPGDDDRGELTARDIERVVDRDTPAVRRCYARHALSQPRANGKFALDLVIRPGGRVGMARVDAPTVRGPQFARCVARVARKWRFPASGGTTRVTYPFHFVHTHARGAGPAYRRRR